MDVRRFPKIKNFSFLEYILEQAAVRLFQFLQGSYGGLYVPADFGLKVYDRIFNCFRSLFSVIRIKRSMSDLEVASCLAKLPYRIIAFTSLIAESSFTIFPKILFIDFHLKSVEVAHHSITLFHE